VFRDATSEELLIELIQNILRPDPPGNMRDRTFPDVLVDLDQDPEGPQVCANKFLKKQKRVVDSQFA
jgi:hypothetical protein